MTEPVVTLLQMPWLSHSMELRRKAGEGEQIHFFDHSYVARDLKTGRWVLGASGPLGEADLFLAMLEET